MKRCFSSFSISFLVLISWAEIGSAQVTEFPVGKIVDLKAEGCEPHASFLYAEPRIEVDGYHAVDIFRCKGRPFVVISRLVDVANNKFEVVRSYRLPKLQKKQSIWAVDCTFDTDKTIYALAIGTESAWGAGAKLSKKTYAAILSPKFMEIIAVKPSQVTCGFKDDRD